jgi:hypothetical protein
MSSFCTLFIYIFIFCKNNSNETRGRRACAQGAGDVVVILRLQSRHLAGSVNRAVYCL